MKAIRLALLASCLLSLASCWMPPFDPALSASALTARKLERVASIGPIEYSGVIFMTSYFVPSYEANPLDGYWICRESDNRIVLRYVGIMAGMYGVGPRFDSEPNRWGDLNSVQAMSATSAGDSLSTSLQKAVHIWGGGTVGAGPSEAMLGVGLDTAYSFQPPATAATSGFSFDMTPIGGSAKNSVSPGLWQNLLMSGYDAGAYILSVGGPIPQMHTAPYGSPIIYNYPLNYSGPELRPGAFFLEYTDASALTYDLVVGRPKGSNHVVGLRWNAADRSAPPTAVDFDSQISDALHDKTLLAREENATKFYDVDGRFLFAVPTGALRFIHEYFDGTVWYSYFTRTIRVGSGHDDSKGKVYFDVFRCPTAELERLAD